MKHILNKFRQMSGLNKLAAIGVAAIIMLGGYLLVSSYAAGLFASVEPEGHTVSGPAKIVNDSSASGGKAIQFLAAQTTPPATGGWWKPTADKPIQMHWQLSSKFNPATDFVPGATVYDIDGEWATKEDVAAIHAKGFVAICYIDVGVYETYRTDAWKYPGKIPDGTRGINPDTGKAAPAYAGDAQYANVDIIGGKDGDWEGSYWLDIRRLDILGPIMQARMQMCKDKGFDAVEPDEQNVENNKAEAGFPVTVQDQLTYNKWLADTAHALGLSIGLKSDIDHAAQSASWYDWNLTEQCYEYNECDNLKPFKDANKATWIVEYAKSPNCTHAIANHFNAQRRDLNLVGPKAGGYSRTSCTADGATTW